MTSAQWVEVCRASVRPILTLLFGGAFIYFTATGIVPREAFVATATAVVIWWFRSRDEAHRPGPSGGPNGT